MTDLPADAVRRIAVARRKAERELKQALSAVAESGEVGPYLPAFTAFVSAVFDAEAGELRSLCEDGDAFWAELMTEVVPRIVEGVLPDQGLNMIWEGMSDELKKLFIVQDVEAGLLWEEGSDGRRKPARPEACGLYARHGDWENFVLTRDWCLLRFLRDKETVPAVLSQALQLRAASRFPSRKSGGSIRVRDERNDSATAHAALIPAGTQPKTSFVVGSPKKPRKRGPKPDFDAAARVAEIVARIAPDEEWRPHEYAIREALDEAQVPCPRTWSRRDKGCDCWAAQLNRATAIKAIEGRLKIARKKPIPETLS